MEKFILAYIELVLRYVFFAGIPFLIFYVWKKARFDRFKIQQKYPEKKKINEEIKNALVSFLIFSLIGIATFACREKGITLVYDNIHDRGWGWFFISIGLMILLHDTYFYWTHRLMHLKKLFPLFHRTHHLSNNPSPWSAFSFAPAEAAVQASILPLIAFTIPAHPAAIVFFLLFMTAMNVVGHVGYEFFPLGFTKNRFFKWSNTSTHHNMHHQYIKCNYGLYFNIWDTLMNSNHERYHNHFEDIKARTKNLKEIDEAEIVYDVVRKGNVSLVR